MSDFGKEIIDDLAGLRDELQSNPSETDCSSFLLFSLPAKELTAIIYDMNEAVYPTVDWSEDAGEMHFAAIRNLKRDLAIAVQRLVELTGHTSVEALHETVGELD